MFAKLTETTPGVYELPVIRTVTSFGKLVVEVGGRTFRPGQMDREARKALGWFDLVVDGVPDNKRAGAPSDTFDGNTVRRSFPSQVYKDITILKEKKMEDLGRTAAAILLEPVVTNGVTITPTLQTISELLALNSHGGLTAIRTDDGLVETPTSVVALIAKALVDRLADVNAAELVHQTAIRALTGKLAVVNYDLQKGWPVS
jgi:hypothetical protein